LGGMSEHDIKNAVEALKTAIIKKILSLEISSVIDPNDLCDLIITLLDTGQIVTLRSDLEIILGKTSTDSILDWLWGEMTKLRITVKTTNVPNNVDKRLEEKTEKEDQKPSETETVVKKSEEPLKSRKLSKETNESDQRLERMKRFGVPVNVGEHKTQTTPKLSDNERNPLSMKKLKSELVSEKNYKGKVLENDTKEKDINWNKFKEKKLKKVLKKKEYSVEKIEEIDLDEDIHTKRFVVRDLPKISQKREISEVSTQEPPTKKLKIESTSTMMQTKNKAQRCVFYPNCTKDDCPFVHPKEDCRYFPNCPYGNLCVYIHPSCKYLGRCSRPNCMYYHPVQNKTDCKNGFACPNQTECQFRHPLVGCKFGRTCKNSGTCLFSHEKACQFGTKCHLSACRFAHPPAESTVTVIPSISEEQITLLSNSLEKTPPRERETTTEDIDEEVQNTKIYITRK